MKRKVSSAAIASQVLLDAIKSMPKTTEAERKSSTVSGAEARPFVQWVGGKREMISRYPMLIPKSYRNYHEPFLGGGAMLFHLRPKKAMLSDSNSELIKAYEGVRDDVETVISLLNELKSRHSKDLYLFVRGLDRLDTWEEWSNMEIAARLIYLNQTGFNGLYRVNRKGQFNVPIGSSLNRVICDAEGLRSASKLLSAYKFRSGDFSGFVKSVRQDDFVFMDPPYAPISAYSDFTRYTKEQFGVEDQKRVAKIFYEAEQRGAKILLTNSNTSVIRQLYQDFNIYEIQSSRALNSKAERRSGGVTELAITNYEVSGL